MSVEFAVCALGSTMGVRLDDSLPPADRDAILRQWRHMRVDGEPDARFLVSTERISAEDAGDVIQVVSPDLTHLPDLLASAVTRAGLRGLFGDAFMLHAAGLSVDDGRVVILVGPSGRGKTTASQAMGQTLGYVSDETIAVRMDGTVIPYPKPLSIGHRPGVKNLFAPVDLGMTPASGALRAGVFVLMDRHTEHVDARVESVSLMDALPELVGQSSSLARLAHPLHVVARMVAATGGVRRVVYSEAEQLVGLVPALLAGAGDAVSAGFEGADDAGSAGSDVAAVPDSHGAGAADARGAADAAEPSLGDPASGRDTGPTSASDAGTGIRRAPYDDVLEQDGRLAVLAAGSLHILEGIGPAVWRSADGVSEEGLRTRVTALVGEPPDGVDVDAVIADAVARLTGAGLILTAS